jgi:hypothetical protein
MPLIDWALRIIPATILLVLGVILVRRNFYREFPFFFAYIVFAPIATVMRVSARAHPKPYFVTYWSTEAVFAILALLALNEVFKSMFDLDYAEHWWFKFILPVMAVAIAMLFLGQPLRPTVSARISNAVFSFDLGVHFLQTIILLLFFVLEKVLGASYDQYEQGIIAGFGISAGFTILVDGLRVHGGAQYTAYFTYVPPIAYILAAAIWLRAFVKEPPPHQRLPIPISELLALLKRQGEIAERINKKWKLWRYQN